MRHCPHCFTQYTDDTLKFCLQDGTTLMIVKDEDTVAFDGEVFANEETIAENFSDVTKNYTGKTEELSSRQTEGNKQNIVINPPKETFTQETIMRQREIARTPNFENIAKTKKTGLGFLTGFIIGILIIGLLGIGVLAVIFLPNLLGQNTRVNSNAANTNTNTNLTGGKILNDSEEVEISASSSRKPEKGNVYTPRLAFDGNSRTAWSEGVVGPGKGQWIAFDFKEELNLKTIIIEPGYFKTEEIWRKNNRISVANVKFSDGTARNFKFNDEMKEQKIALNNVNTKSVMITIIDIYEGQADSKDTLISEVKFVAQEK